MPDSSTHSINLWSCVRCLPQWGQYNFVGTHLSEAAIDQYPSQDWQVKCHIVSLLTRITDYPKYNNNPHKGSDCNRPIESLLHIS